MNYKMDEIECKKVLGAALARSKRDLSHMLNELTIMILEQEAHEEKIELFREKLSELMTAKIGSYGNIPYNQAIVDVKNLLRDIYDCDNKSEG